MLWRVLQSNGGLPSEAVVCFANTGKEDEATLRFVEQCSREWAVPITWLEYQDNEPGYLVVDFETASRQGEPFESLLNKRSMLPNPVARYCTGQLKIRVVGKYLHDIGIAITKSDGEQISWIGIRADEPRRAAKIEDKSRIPLWAANVTKELVGEFWRNQSFDLQLPNNNGVTMHGNCDLCYLKPMSQIVSLIREKPSRVIWWAKQEYLAEFKASTARAARFRQDRPSYKEMAKFAEQQIDMFDPNEEGISCFCGD